MQNTDIQPIIVPNLDNLDALTRQEEKVIQLASEDFSNKEIATKLGTSLATIKKHRENVYRKFDICGKTKVRRFMRKVQKFFERK